VSGSGISWAICKDTHRSRQITMPAPHRWVFYRPDALLPPNRQSTEGMTCTVQTEQTEYSQCLFCWEFVVRLCTIWAVHLLSESKTNTVGFVVDLTEKILCKSLKTVAIIVTRNNASETCICTANQHNYQRIRANKSTGFYAHMNIQTRHFHTTKISFYYTTLKIVLLSSVLKNSTQPKICPATVKYAVKLCQQQTEIINFITNVV